MLGESRGDEWVDAVSRGEGKDSMHETSQSTACAEPNTSVKNGRDRFKERTNSQGYLCKIPDDSRIQTEI